MSRILTGMFAAALLAAGPLAQGQTAAPDPKPQPTASESKDETPRPARETAPSGPDPRVCLELSTNLAIHMCAEKYRPRRRAG